MAKIKTTIFETSLHKAARMLADRYNINVVFSNDPDMVPNATNKEIILPATTELLTDGEQKLLHGHLDHEVAHCIFTDFGLLKEAFPEEDPTSKTRHLFWNAVEDVRIEKKMRALYPGSNSNLNHKDTMVSQSMTLQLEEEAKNEKPMDQASKMFWFSLMYATRGFKYDLGVFDLLSPEEKNEVEYYGKYFYRAVDGTPKDAMEASNAFYEDFVQRSGDVKEEEVPSVTQFLKKLVSAKGYESPTGSPRKYLVATTKNDTVERVTGGSGSVFKRLRDASAKSVNVIRKRMQKAIHAKKNTLWEFGKNSGSLNSRSYADAYLGTSRAIFKQKVTKLEVNTVFDIMIDHSGSMSGSIHLATQTAVALGELLSLLGAPFSIRGFTTGNSGIAADVARGMSEENRKMFTRFGAHKIFLYKDYDEIWAHSCNRMSQALTKGHCMINTYDAESLKFSVNHLIERPEPRKILFWLNDGAPYPNSSDDRSSAEQHLRDVVKEAEKYVEIIAIGIQTDAVKEFFQNYVVVNDISRLAEEALIKLEKILIKNINIYGR